MPEIRQGPRGRARRRRGRIEMPGFIVGVDVGQAHDHTALAIVQPRWRRDDPEAALAPIYDIRYLDRAPLGTSYPGLVRAIARMLTQPPLDGGARLIVDATGVGRPIVDLFIEHGLRPIAVTVTAGDQVNGRGRAVRVPKRDIASSLQRILQEERLRIASALHHAGTLVDEMLDFRVRITASGHDQYGTWREGAHDDLVFAVAIALWHAERRLARNRRVMSSRAQAVVIGR